MVVLDIVPRATRGNHGKLLSVHTHVHLVLDVQSLGIHDQLLVT